MKRLTWTFPALTALGVALISFLKSWHCRSNFFASPDSYTHLCYSDIPALFGSRGLNLGINPYADPTNSMEYPVGTGYIASFLARFSSDFIEFFDINVIAIAILFVATIHLLSRQAEKDWPLLALAPAVISSLYINWDLWAIFALLLSFHFLHRERSDLAGIFLGLSIAIKFFPIFLIPAAVIYFYLRKDRTFLSFFGYTALTLIATNLSTAIFYFDGWVRFFTFNQERGVDLGSLWYALNLLFDLTFKHLNLVAVIIALLLASLIYRPLRNSLRSRANSYEIFLLLSFLSLALIFSLNKVYSPQYVLWLTPIAVLLLATSRDTPGNEGNEGNKGNKGNRENENYKKLRAYFWIWQAGEAIYHLGVWQYLAEYSGGQGLSEPLYAISILIRIASLAVFAVSVARVRLSLPSTGPAHAGLD